MQGKVHFESEESLGKFIGALIPVSTAMFEVYPDSKGGFTLTFTGGY